MDLNIAGKNALVCAASIGLGACAYLCSTQASYITGQNLLLLGGADPGTF